MNWSVFYFYLSVLLFLSSSNCSSSSSSSSSSSRTSTTASWLAMCAVVDVAVVVELTKCSASGWKLGGKEKKQKKRGTVTMEP